MGRTGVTCLKPWATRSQEAARQGAPWYLLYQFQTSSLESSETAGSLVLRLPFAALCNSHCRKLDLLCRYPTHSLSSLCIPGSSGSLAPRGKEPSWHGLKMLMGQEPAVLKLGLFKAHEAVQISQPKSHRTGAGSSALQKRKWGPYAFQA